MRRVGEHGEHTITDFAVGVYDTARFLGRQVLDRGLVRRALVRHDAGCRMSSVFLSLDPERRNWGEALGF
jgi:hypothetical protein